MHVALFCDPILVPRSDVIWRRNSGNNLLRRECIKGLNEKEREKRKIIYQDEKSHSFLITGEP